MHLTPIRRKAPDAVSFETLYGEKLSYPEGAMRASLVLKTKNGFGTHVELCWDYGCACEIPHADYTEFCREHYGDNQVLWL